MTVFVVPDSNVIYTDPFFDRPLVRTFLAAEETSGLRLMIPAVVIDETRNQIKLDLFALVRAAASQLQDFRSSAGMSPGHIDLQETMYDKQAYLERFDRRIQQFREAGRILEYPSATNQDIALRSIRREPPFLDKDRGFRDTLIWLSIKEQLLSSLDTGSKIILVTKDNAFYDSDNKLLHEHLIAEVVGVSKPTCAVVAQRSLGKVVSDHAIGCGNEVDWVRDLIKSGDVIGFEPDGEEVMFVALRWISKNWSDMEDIGKAIVSRIPLMGFQLRDNANLADVKRPLDLGNGIVSVGSEWTSELYILEDELQQIEAYSGFPVMPPKASVTFNMTSLLECIEQRCVVQSHQIVSATWNISGYAAR